MAKEQILDKLSKKLQHPPASEEDVVYILSRIRKILEINLYPKKYTILKFYCNLALHSKINDVPPDVYDKFRDTIKDDDLSADYSILFHAPFHAQLKIFLMDYNLPNFYDNNFRIADFNKLLYAIYSDTPIIIEEISGRKYQITFSEDGTMGGSPIND